MTLFCCSYQIFIFKNSPGNVGVVWPKDERMVGFDQITQVVVDERGLVNVLHNRQPTEPEKSQ